MTSQADRRDLERLNTPTKTDWGRGTSDRSRFAAAESFLGQTLADQYRLLEIIGAGGFGVVFRARQLKVERDVAVKILHPQMATDAVAVQRFENEARIVSQLRHPNTLRLHDTGRAPNGLLFIVTELLSGRPLSDVLASSGRLPLDRSVFIIDAICGSLAEAHAAGIVHRDLKPENVYIDRVGSDDVVKVLDFGIAKILECDARITRPGSLSGTPHYMSPELASGGTVDGRADVYALGIMLYQMLSGELPFPGTSLVEVLKGHLFEPPPSLSVKHPELLVPVELDALIQRMLEKSPDQRPRSVDEVRRHVSRITGLRGGSHALLFAPEADGSPGEHPRSDTLSAHIEGRDFEAPIEARGHDRRFTLAWLVAAACALLLLSGVVAWYVSIDSARTPIERGEERQAAPQRALRAPIEDASAVPRAAPSPQPDESGQKPSEHPTSAEPRRSKSRTTKAHRTPRSTAPKQLGDRVLPVDID